jgi:hypothetical protein
LGKACRAGLAYSIASKKRFSPISVRKRTSARAALMGGAAGLCSMTLSAAGDAIWQHGDGNPGREEPARGRPRPRFAMEPLSAPTGSLGEIAEPMNAMGVGADGRLAVK